MKYWENGREEDKAVELRHVDWKSKCEKVFHCAASFFPHLNCRYPSADHYAHAMILTQLGLDETLILELLCTSSGDVPTKVLSRHLLFCVAFGWKQ